MAAAVERIVAVFVIQDARKADLPLVAVTTELRIQAQTAAVQVLKTRDALAGVTNDKLAEPCDYQPQGAQCVAVVSRERSRAGKW